MSSSPVTLSGFNNVDFNSIISALLQAQRAPIRLAQSQQSDIQLKANSLSTLQSRVGSLKSQASGLNSSSLFAATTATSSNTSVFTATSSESTAIANHSITVKYLAKAQTTVSTSTFGSPDDVLATGGSVFIAGKEISVSGSTTVQQFADQVNATADIGVMASAIDTGGGSYRLVLTGTSSGASKAFTITSNTLSGGAGLAFTDFNSNGTSGDSPEDNTVNARDSEVVIDGLTINRAGNTVSDALPGVTINLLKEDAANTHSLSIARDTAGIVSQVQQFVTSYNDLASYMQAEYTIGTTTKQMGPLAGEAVLRTTSSLLRSSLRDAVSVGGTYAYLSEVGITFDRSGNLVLDSGKLTDTINNSPSDVQKLFQGDGGSSGVFDNLVGAANSLTAADGILSNTETNFNDSIANIDQQISDMEAQIELSRKALVQEFAAVDQLMSSMNRFTSLLQGLQSGK